MKNGDVDLGVEVEYGKEKCRRIEYSIKQHDRLWDSECRRIKTIDEELCTNISK